MKKILLPTDFSASAENAIAYGLKLAQEFSAQIDVLHIYNIPIWLEGEVAPELVLQKMEQAANLAQEKVHTFLQSYPSDSIGKQIAVQGTAVAREIVNLAETDNYDLIIMGMQGEHAVLEKIMGSVTTRTIGQAPCPVLAIPAEARFQSMDRIAYATDLDTSDQPAVENLMTFAGLLGAQVHFVHIETQPDLGQMEDRVQLENYPFDFVDFTILNNPSVVKGLDLYTQEKEIDLLVLFAPKRRLWERIFHVSLTKRLAFQSKLPLLVFRN